MAEPSEPPQENHGRLRRFIKEHGLVGAVLLATGGAIFTFIIWVTGSVIRYNVYVEDNYGEQIREMRETINRQQGEIGTLQKRVDCQELQFETGKNYVVVGSTYECVEKAEETKPSPK